jgi:hypothetical protein
VTTIGICFTPLTDQFISCVVYRSRCLFVIFLRILPDDSRHIECEITQLSDML